MPAAISDDQKALGTITPLVKEGWQPEGVIWPDQPARWDSQASLAEFPLAGAQDYWAKIGSRLRDAAAWMATVLGAGSLLSPTPRRLPSRQHIIPMTSPPSWDWPASRVCA